LWKLGQEVISNMIRKVLERAVVKGESYRKNDRERRVIEK